MQDAPDRAEPEAGGETVGRQDALEDGTVASRVAYVCSESGATFDARTPLWRSPAGAPLDLSPGPGLSPREIDTAERSLWRYGAAIRIEPAHRLTMGEGFTPLVPGAFDGRPVHFKLEYVQPTGSYKDRGTAVLLAYLKSVGVGAILEDSSGNAGASMAAYAAFAGIDCTILVPETIPEGKRVQMAAMGARVERVAGTRQDVADAALRLAETVFYASHNWQPFFVEGTKTLAFELWEQLGFDLPDDIVVPLGYGANVLGLWLGFAELRARGEIDRIPRIHGAQAANCAAFAAAFDAGVDHPVDIEPRPTMADGIASVRPVRTRAVLDAVRGSGGRVIAVPEEEIAAALKTLMASGFFVEPTSATAAAALRRLVADGAIADGGRTIVVLTGTGLKAAGRIAEILAG